LTQIRIKKGLDIPLAGEPEQRIDEAQPVRSVAVLGPDIVGLRARMQVDKGDRVRLGHLPWFMELDPEQPWTLEAGQIF